MDHIAESLRRVSQLYDDHLADRDPEAATGIRMMKLAEEIGESIGGWLGVSGANPRKGYTHTRDEVKTELLDTAVTALAAWEHLDGNRGAVMDALAAHVRRLDARGGADSGEQIRAERPDVRHTGRRDELVGLLNEHAEGWHHLANDRLYREALDGAAKLQAGDSSVRVGHTVYEVTDVSPSATVD